MPSVHQNRGFLRALWRRGIIIILPGASLRNAIKNANLICKSIASTRYRLDDETNEQTLHLTVSIGVSCHQKADTTTSVIKRVDDALYVAKNARENRVYSLKDVELSS